MYFLGVKAAGAYDNLTISILQLSTDSGRLNLLQPSGLVQTFIWIVYPYLYLSSIPFPYSSFYISSLLIPPCPFIFPCTFLSHIHFLLLSSAFSYFSPNRPAHSFCFTFQQFAGCVSQLRTDNFWQYFITFTDSHNSLLSSLTHSPYIPY